MLAVARSLSPTAPSWFGKNVRVYYFFTESSHFSVLQDTALMAGIPGQKSPEAKKWDLHEWTTLKQPSERTTNKLQSIYRGCGLDSKRNVFNLWMYKCQWESSLCLLASKGNNVHPLYSTSITGIMPGADINPNTFLQSKVYPLLSICWNKMFPFWQLQEIFGGSYNLLILTRR